MKYWNPVIFLICYLTALQPSFGQTQKTDSLWTVWYDSTQADTNRLKAIRTIVWDVYLFSQPDSAFYLAQQQFDMAKDKGYKNHMASALNMQGIASGIMGNYNLSVTRFVHAYNLYESENDKGGMAKMHGNIGLILIKQGNYLKAIEYYDKCLKIQEELKDSFGLANSLDNLGTIYDIQGHHDQALSHYTKSLELLMSLNAKPNIAYILINIGATFAEKEEYLKAKDNYMQSLIISEKNNDNILMSNAIIGLGYIEQKLGKYSLAMDHFSRALKLTKKSGDKEAISSSSLGLAAVHALQGNHPKAIEYATNALEIASMIPSQTKAAAKTLYESFKAIGQNRKALEMYELYIQMDDSIVNEETQKASIRQQFKFTYEKKAVADSLQHAAAIGEQDIKIAFQNKLGGVLLGSLFIVLVFSFLLFKRFKITRNQKRIIEDASIKTKDSIQYAERIQQAILPSMGYIESCLDEFYILYKPKDIVSGDFYWVYKQKNENILIALADCTGHGVPGAFMSMIGTALLNEIIIENGVTKVNTVLDTIRTNIINSFEQRDANNYIYDGLDITLIDLNPENRTLTFSGARQRFYILRDREFIELKGNNCPVGYYYGKEKPFDLKEITLRANDQLYLFSDGIIDQFGGKNRKKFGSNQLKEVILESAHLPMDEQNKMLEAAILSWQGNYEQIDDISVMGIKVS